MANPTGPQVIRGQAQFSQPDVNTLNITNSAGAILHWQQFSIQQNETTRFIQPSMDSSVLNRVVGQDPSDILGHLLSNGRVFLINPNGIVFGPDSIVDTAGLVASTLNMTDADFQAGTYHFEGADAGAIESRGYIKAGANGDIFLIAPNIENSGIIETDGGKLILAAGQSVTLASLDSDNIVYDIQAPDNAVVNLGSMLTHGGAAAIFAGTIKHSGTINADSIRVDNQGRVQLYAQENISIDKTAVISADGPRGGSVKIDAETTAYLDTGSRISAGSTAGDGGSIDINAGTLYQLGDIHADGDAGGTVQINAGKIQQSGQVTADAGNTHGGMVSITGNEIIQTASAAMSAQGGSDGTGGIIDIRGDGQPGSSLFSSASINAGGVFGGRIVLTADDVVLRGASIDASGTQGGGQVFLGGGWQGGNPAISNSLRVDANFSNAIHADAGTSGDGGVVVVWSDEKTRYMGDITARGGEQAGNGGYIEISGKNELVFGGTADAGALNGTAGMLLLDPKNVTVDTAGGGSGGIGTIDLVDPNIGSGDFFPTSTNILGNGNILAMNPNDDFSGTDAGAVYLYDGTTGALISALTGASAGDKLGDTFPTFLSGTNNFLLVNTGTDIAGQADVGSVTFGNAVTGVSGAVSAANSLVGGTAGDQIGSSGVMQLFTTGKYLVSSPNADVGGVTDAGAVSFGDSSTGLTGTVSTSNSLVGGSTGDQIGSGTITQLNNGNYVVTNIGTDIGGVTDVGSVTFGNGTTGVVGVVSATNSLVGSVANDQIGSYGVTTLQNSNYLVQSGDADISGVTDAGAVTFGSGTTGITGVVSSSNSLVGGSTGDQIGSNIIVQLYASGNYLVVNPLTDLVGGLTDAGSVTFGSGTSGVTGVVSAANSLVGGAANSNIGSSGITQLSSGNYLVLSPGAVIGGQASAGAVTFGNGTTGVTGTVSASNSLVGNAANDDVGNNGIVVLNNGNYLVPTPVADISGNVDAGAVTFGSGTTGVAGAISAANSLVGGTANDNVGLYPIIPLSNGNYLVPDPDADINGVTDAGVVTFGDGTTGVAGVISDVNSLAGGATNDRLGSNYVTELFQTGNYLVINPLSDIGGQTDAGSVTFGSGTTGVSGVISASNSLVGGTASDAIGGAGMIELSTGKYLINSPFADIGGIPNAGAVSVGDSNTGLTGVVSAANSLVGGTANDQIGSYGIETLNNDNYLVISPLADIGGRTDAGAVTFGNGTTGITGTVSSSNSLVGGTAGDQVGNYGVSYLSNSNYLVLSPNADIGAMTDAGAATFGSGTTGVTGVVSSSNSLVGGAAGDMIGSGSVLNLFGTSNYLLVNTGTDVGGMTDAGSVTFFSGTTGITGVVSSSNSLVGGAANDQIGNYGIYRFYPSGNYLVRSPNVDIGGNTDVGAVTFGSGTSGVTGVVSSSNSLVGGAAGDMIGSYIYGLSDTDNYLVVNPGTDVGGMTDAGSVTFGDSSTGVTGVVSAANSLVGGAANDQIGSAGIYELYNTGNYLVRSPLADIGGVNDVGALTFGSGTSGVAGVVSSTNSLVGSVAGDQVGSSTIYTLASGYLVVNPLADIGGVVDVGTITYGDATTGVVGVVSLANSLIGASAGDQVGSGGVTNLGSDRFLVRSPYYDNGMVDSGRLQIAFPGSGSSVTLPLLFADNAAADVTVTPAQITAVTNTGTAVMLQANNDITVNSPVITSAAGFGGALTLQAGRSIIINADITTDNGALTITANETAANGVVDANRDPGMAVITMADGTTLDAGTGNIIITLSNGAGLTNSSAGDITLANLIAGDIDITLNSPSDNSDILRTSANVLIKANSLFIDHDPLGGSGGSIGTLSEPLLVETPNLSAHTHDTASPGVFIDSPNPLQDVVIGNTFYGQSHLIKGVETVSSGDIVLHIGGSVTVSEPVFSSGTLSLESGAGPITINNDITASGDTSLTVTSGTGAITQNSGSTIDVGTNTLTLMTQGGTITLTELSNVYGELVIDSAGGAVTVDYDSDLVFGDVNAGVMTVNSSGAISQNGPMVATSLTAISDGTITLTNSSNNIGQFNADVIGSAGVSLVSTNTLNVTGLSVQSGDIDINITGSPGDLSLNSDIATSGNVSLKASGSLLMTDVSISGNNIQLSGSTVQLTADTGMAQVSAAGNLDILNSGDIIIQGSDIAANGSAKMTVDGAVTIGAASLTILGGDADFAPAGIDPTSLDLTLSGNLTLTGGAGNMSEAILAGNVVTMNVTGDTSLTGGAGSDAYAIINAVSGDVTINSGSLTMLTGTGSNADAAIIANSGSGAVNSTIGICNNCDVLLSDPLTDTGSQFGFFGSYLAPTTSAPSNQQVIVLNDFTFSDLLAFIYPDQQQEEEEEKDILECK